MMNSQQLEQLSALLGSPSLVLSPGFVMPLGRSGGELEVIRGRVWLTRGGEAEDRVVADGEAVHVPASGSALIEAWDDGAPALVAWRPRSLKQRLGDALRRSFVRCFELVDPVRRIGAGSLAAVAALLVGAAVFGPLSDARLHALAAPAVLHNGVAAGAAASRDSAAGEGHVADVAVAPRPRSRVAAQEAGRRAPGAA